MPNNPCKSKTVGSVLGSGSYGTVYILEDNKSKKFTALKVQNDTYDTVGEFESLVEIDLLFKIDSNTLVKGLNIYNSEDCKDVDYTSIELPLLKDVTTLLGSPSLTIQKRIFFIYKLLLGTKTLHDNGFLHLDIKPENLLYSNGDYGPELVLSDFGLSQKVENINYGIKTNKVLGTIYYRPPEMFNTARLNSDNYYDFGDDPDFLTSKDKLEFHYTNKFDIWSIGLTALYILQYNKVKTFKYPDSTFNSTYNRVLDDYNYGFTDNKISETLENVLDILKLSPNSGNMRDDLKELLMGLLSYDPENRFDIDQALNSRLFRETKISKVHRISRLPFRRKTAEEIKNAKKVDPYVKIIDTKSYSNLVDQYTKNEVVKMEKLNIAANKFLKYIFAVYEGELSNFYVRDLFHSIDLYMRLIISARNLSYSICKNIALLSMRMTYKYFYKTDNLMPKKFKSKKLIRMEIEAIKFFKGVIMYENFYDRAQSFEEIKLYLEKLTDYDFSAFDSYFIIDTKALQLEISNRAFLNNVKSVNSANKYVSCAKVFESLDIQY